MNPLVFLGGPPGAGKSTAAAGLRARWPHLFVANAGELIRAHPGAGGGRGRVPVADGQAAARFQELLVAAVGELVDHVRGPVLLDGHFAVPTPRGPEPVSAGVFARLGCTLLVRLDASVEELAERLNERGGAAWWDGSLGMLDELCEVDRLQARIVSRALGLGLHEAGSVAAVGEVLDGFLERYRP